MTKNISFEEAIANFSALLSVFNDAVTDAIPRATRVLDKTLAYSGKSGDRNSDAELVLRELCGYLDEQILAYDDLLISINMRPKYNLLQR
jgi:hypothetical protein